MGSLLLSNIQGLVLAEKMPRKVIGGADMAQIPVENQAFLLIESERIISFGSMEKCPVRADQIIDCTGRFVLPCWCDSHTHLVFAASREEEFVDRIRGLSYEEIARRGGGILNSAQRLQQLPENALFDSAWERLQEVIRYGTGAIEIKSGYGLTVESELKMLRVIRRLKERASVPIKATFLGAHAIPAAYRERREEYVALIIQQMLPRVAAEGLAEYCDVFCDRGFFTPAETDRILKAAWQFGLKPKIHANELGITGGVQVGVANGAISVDHLEHIDSAEIKELRGSHTLPVMLPNCSFFLGLPYAPARRMIDAGLAVVLASDYNPGSSPSGKMPFVLSLACTQMKMLPEEAICAATINGARAMELEDECGSIAPGKLANVIVTRPVPSLAFLPYAFGSEWIERVIIRGKQV